MQSTLWSERDAAAKVKNKMIVFNFSSADWAAESGAFQARDYDAKSHELNTEVLIFSASDQKMM